MTERSDVLVLGAGIVGVSAALHLQARGRSVTVLDRRGPGEETSFGNAGLIERSSVIPYHFPPGLRSLLAYAANRSTAVRYFPGFLPAILPWLARYWWHSQPGRLAEIATAMLPLIERSVSEHDALIDQAGARHLVRREGWIELYRSAPALQAAAREAEDLHRFKLQFEVLDGPALKGREPWLSDTLAGGIHWRDPASVSDPGAVVQAYAALFERRGGRIVKGDASTLAQAGAAWQVGDAEGGTWEAEQAVLALGPWSGELCRRLGYRMPLAVKRGYHMHYSGEGGASLTRPVCDSEAGYVLAPMRRGIRLTTGVEFAPRDAPPGGAQLRLVEPLARRIFPLGERLDGTPWRGARPCFPDMKPLIGPAPRHAGLWFAFGHAHHGFTLGPVTGRVLAEAMTGERPGVDLAPFRFRW